MKLTKQTKRLMATGTLLTVCVVGGGVWLSGIARPSADNSRKVVCYQDSMHPWIKSDQPGKCTICAMDLTPIYEGELGFATAGDVVVLSSNSVTVLNVQTEEVTPQPLYRTLRAAGTLEADSTRKTVIGAPAPGRIDAVAIESAGVQVERGQVLASFYSPDLSFQTRRYIFRDRITTREDMTARASQLGSSRHTPRVNEATSSHPVPATEQADPFYNDLLSPQSGTVVERSVYAGQYVAEGDRLFVIVDLSVLWFRFDVYEQQLPWLAAGQEVEITVPAVPGRVFKATISVIEPSFLEATRTAKVRAEVENPVVGDSQHAERLLRLGMYAEARIRAVGPDLLVVPRSAILFPGGHAYAYLDKGNGAYEMRQVQLGRQGDTHWEILAGLEAGDRVVTSGNVLIDAQSQFTRSTQPGGPEETTPVSGTGPLPEPLNPDQKKFLNDFLKVADGVSTALASDALGDLQQHVGRLPTVVTSLATALEKDPAWHGLMERVKSTSRWPESTDLAAARKAFLPFSTNVVELVEAVRSREESFQSLKVFFCPMAPKPGVWFQANGPLRNPYYGADMLSCGEEVKPRLLARKAPSQPALTASAHSSPMAASSSRLRDGHPAGSGQLAAMMPAGMPATPKSNLPPAAGNSVPESSLTVSQVKSLELLLTVAGGLSEALAADELEAFQRSLVKLPALLPAVQQEFPAAHPFHKGIERINESCRAPAVKDLAQARKIFLPLSTNVVDLVQQLRREEPVFQSLKVFACSMAPEPGLWFQSQGPLRNPYFGAEMLTCGKEVALAFGQAETAGQHQAGGERVKTSAPLAKAGEAANSAPAADSSSECCSASAGSHGAADLARGSSTNSSPQVHSPAANPASAPVLSHAGIASVPRRAAHYTNSGDALRLRMANFAAAAKAPAPARADSKSVTTPGQPLRDGKSPSVLDSGPGSAKPESLRSGQVQVQVQRGGASQ